MRLKELLAVENLNSRFCFLLTTVTVCICVLALVVAVIWKGIPENAIVLEAYGTLVGILLGGGLAGAAGRWLTGKNPVAGAVGEASVEVVSKEVTTTKIGKAKK